MLHYIIPSKARRKVLELFFVGKKEPLYLRKIVRETGEEVNAIKRELDILFESKILLREKRLNKVFYSLNKNHAFHDELLKIFVKLSPFAQGIYENISKIGRVKHVVMSKVLTKNLPLKKDEVYVLFVGTIVVPEVEPMIELLEKQIGEPVNYTVMNEEEFVFRKKNNDPFIWNFLRQPLIIIIGSEDDVLK